MPSSSNPYQQTLLDSLKKKRLLDNPAVEAAFRATPRHLFLPDLPLEQVYLDSAIPLKHDLNGLVISSSTQPTMMAIMIDQLQLEEGDNILEIGTASGYNAAVLKRIVGPEGHVTTIELDKDLADQAKKNLARAGSGVTVVNADGMQGYAPRAAYDHIVSTAGIWDVPVLWLRQLKPRGTLVAPIWLNGVQVSATFRQEPDGTYYSDDNRPCEFVYLRGAAAGPELRKQIGSTSLYMMGEQINKIDSAALHLLLSDDHVINYLESPLKVTDYWYGFQLQLMLSEDSRIVFAVYAVVEGRKAYGMEGRGIALLCPASAAFAPYQERSMVHSFAGADAFLTMQEVLDQWNKQDRPNATKLRLRLIPKEQGEPTVKNGRIYTRHNHYLHVWLDA